MPEYLAPGVYVEEVEIGAKPIEGVSTSTAGFLGPAERGSVNPKFISNFGDFLTKFGGFVENSYLAYSVEGFFRNGGKRCFVGRIIGKGAVTSKGALSKEGEELIEITADGPGEWGNNVVVKLDDATLYKKDKNDLFKITLMYWKKNVEGIEDETLKALGKADVIEVYDNLSPVEASSDYFEKRINDISNLIKVVKKGEGRPDPCLIKLAEGTKGEAIQKIDYTGDPAAGPGERTGLSAFREIDDINIVVVPDENAVEGLTIDIVNHCEEMKDRFAVLQAKQNSGPISQLLPPVDSKYASFNYPWIKIIDPITGVKKMIPPGGHIAGIYARSDIERGVHKAPANEIVRGALEIQFPLTKAEQDILNPKGVNCIRVFPGMGIKLWGARTVSSDPLWKYLNVRRLFLYVEKSIEKGTQWVVFEPNNEKLWARTKQTIVQFLTGVWRSGALMGLTPDEAFFVKCDRTTMTQDDIDNGRLIVMIGIAPVKPAEFVIFRIAQWSGGSAATE